MKEAIFPFPLAVDIGDIEEKDQFINLHGEELEEIDRLGKLYFKEVVVPNSEHLDFGILWVNLQETIDYFSGQTESPAQAILLRFLAKVAADVPTYSSVSTHNVRASLETRLSRYYHKAPLHNDHLESSGSVQMRYLLSNRYPTAIKGLPEHSAGSVARIAGDAMHVSPAYNISDDSPRPRLLLLTDVFVNVEHIHQS